MSDTILSSEITTPNVRFGATFLNTDYHTMAVNDEVLMDKSTGEIVYKRVKDGKFLYHDRERFNTDEYIMQLQVMLNNAAFWLPTIANSNYLTTYLMMLQYNLDKFLLDPTTGSSYEDGGVKKNPYNDSFSISHESTGFFVKIKTRPRDEAVINFTTAKYDNYYKNYNGDDATGIRENALFNNPSYENSNIKITFRVNWIKDGDLINTTDYVGYARANITSYVEFDNYTIPSIEDVDSVQLQILSVSLPKFKLGKDIITGQSESIVLNKVIDAQEIRLLSCEITTTITETEKSFLMPSDTATTILLINDMVSLNEYLGRVDSLGGGNGGGVLLSTSYPSLDEWRTTKLWLERVRDVIAGGETQNVGTSTSFNELEEYFGKPIPTTAGFTVDPTIGYGFYVEQINTKDIGLSW